MFFLEGQVPEYSFNKTTFTIRFNWLESRALGRPHFVLEKARLISVESLVLPGKRELGARISKTSLFLGVLGEYRSGSNRVLVLGNSRGSGPSLKIKVSHPSIDVIWVCGSQVAELEGQLAEFMGITL
jgi:hypothetical protein